MHQDSLLTKRLVCNICTERQVDRVTDRHAGWSTDGQMDRRTGR